MTPQELIQTAMHHHHLAMDHHDTAESLMRSRQRAQGEPALDRIDDEIEKHLYLAMNRERKAARTLAEYPGIQPTRSVLYRSAACLAKLAGKLDECRELCLEGLEGAPPEIEREIRDVLAELDVDAADDLPPE